MIEVFVSHSSHDRALAEAVTDLLEGTIKDLEGVRCTSADGHKLRIGSQFAKELRKDIENCDVFVIIVSKHSLNSQFCLFELGAAWGLEQPIKPILAPGMTATDLKPPLSDLNCLSWDDQADGCRLSEKSVSLLITA